MQKYYYYTIQQATFIWQSWFWKLGFRSHDNMIGLEWCKFTKIYKESHTQSDNILGILGRIWKLLSQFNVHIGGNPYRYVVIFFCYNWKQMWFGLGSFSCWMPLGTQTVSAFEFNPETPQLWSGLIESHLFSLFIYCLFHWLLQVLQCNLLKCTDNETIRR